MAIDAVAASAPAMNPKETLEMPWALIIQTIAAGVQMVAALVFLVGVVLQRRNALIERLLQRWRQTADMPTPDELAGTPYSQEQIDFVNKHIKNRGVWLRWEWRGE